MIIASYFDKSLNLSEVPNPPCCLEFEGNVVDSCTRLCLLLFRDKQNISVHYKYASF